MRRAALSIAFAALALVSSVSRVAADDIVVASKIDTEGALLGNLIAVALEAHGFTVRNKIQLGPTEIVRNAILAGQIDIYPEYTGNGGRFFKRESDPAWRDAERGYDLVRQLDRERNRLVWLTASPANNTWAIAVRKDLAGEQRIATLEDFARFVTGGGTVKLAASAEFAESAGALPAFEQAYGFKLRRAQLLILVGGDTSATIRAAAEKTSGVNAAMAYGTDGALAALDLQALTDNKAAQVFYRPAPVIREAILAKHPNIAQLLEPVFRSLTLDILQKLNARVAVHGQDPRAVATEHLKSERLR
jgi:osmoprotectant transport system substrate-binding protein